MVLVTRLQSTAGESQYVHKKKLFISYSFALTNLKQPLISSRYFLFCVAMFFLLTFHFFLVFKKGTLLWKFFQSLTYSSSMIFLMFSNTEKHWLAPEMARPIPISKIMRGRSDLKYQVSDNPITKNGNFRSPVLTDGCGVRRGKRGQSRKGKKRQSNHNYAGLAA